MGLRMFRRSVALGLLALGLLGCSHKPSEQASGTDRSTGDVLTFYTSLGQAEWNVLRQDVFPPFERANHCRISAIEVESSDMARKLQSLQQGHHMDVDLFGQDNMDLSQLVQGGLVEDLTPYERQIPKETIPALLDVGRFHGKLYFMPYRPNVEITYYNQSYLGKYGLKPPEDWNQLMVVAKTLYEKEGVGRVAIKADGTDASTAHLFDFINQAGGDPMTLNDAGCVKAFSFLQELWPYLSPESRRADFNTMNQFLAMESVYLGQNWPYGVEVVVHQGEKKDVLAYHGWRGPVREAHTLGGEVFGIPKGAVHKSLALKFIAYIESKPVQATLVKRLAWPSMRSDAYGEVPAWEKPYFVAVQEALGHTVARPNVPYWEDFDKLVNLAFRDIVVDRQDVTTTLNKYAALLQKAKAAKGNQ